VASGQVDRLYVHSPDCLARKYAYQVLLVDEWQRAGLEIVFLNRELGGSPEDELLLQMQGMMVPCQQCGAEFEAQRSSARFCSASCRYRAHRAKQPAPIVAAERYGRFPSPL
jgi:hypothetical protein